MAAPTVPLILVVDDDADARKSVREQLESRAFNVVEARNGRDALHYLTGNAPQPELILLDLAMPEMTGWELIALLRTYSKLARIPVIVTTGMASVQEVLGRGISAYLKKPVRDTELFRAIEVALSKSDARQLAYDGEAR